MDNYRVEKSTIWNIIRIMEPREENILVVSRCSAPWSRRGTVMAHLGRIMMTWEYIYPSPGLSKRLVQFHFMPVPRLLHSAPSSAMLPSCNSPTGKGSKVKLILFPVPTFLGFPWTKRTYTVNLWQKTQKKNKWAEFKGPGESPEHRVGHMASQMLFQDFRHFISVFQRRFFECHLT